MVAAFVMLAACSGSDPDSTVAFDDATTEASDSTADQTTSEPLADDSADTGAVTSAPADTAASSEPTTVEETTTVPPTTAAIQQDPLPADCTGVDTPLLPVQVTFTAENKLFGLGFDGQPQCLLVLDPGSEVVAWGAQADKVMFSDGRIEALNNDPDGRAADGVVREWAQFSRPTGFNSVWIADNTLYKSRIDGALERAIELGFPVTEVAYHPDGTNLLVVAQDPTFVGDSVWVTSNEGEEGVPLLFAEDEATISNLVISYDGGSVMFVASHPDGAIHVHRLDMAAATYQLETPDSDEVELILEPSSEVGVETLHEAGSPLSDLVVSADGAYLALAEGTCETGRTVEVIDLVAGGYPLPVMAGRSARPVGFTTAGELIVAVDGPECGGVFDLYSVEIETGVERLIRAQVDSAEVRRIDPPPSYSLTGVHISGFA